MIENTDWLIKPENYRILQKIRKRIRSIYGTDIRITSAADVEALFQYRHDKDATLATMLEDLSGRIERASGRPVPQRAGQSDGPVKMYRGQVVA
ncbi:hypothetical protein [Saccharospirillum salsuginis]|uniref:Uncharacterized protein n=1 Tax=Saccharospirillum salsuginis TaxID=418750 RepID=A0A918NK59_9GAMM|nr:hypothetical protein [Saccharospirillum salsuginis]GGX74089.1 hypothetical protein GCM10007392_46830 [Saccharospirillum salsuginis]